MFDLYAYLSSLTERNRFARSRDFHSATCSGIHHLEGALDHFRTVANFVLVSDVCDEALFQRSGGWFKRRSTMVFLLMRYRSGDESDRIAKLDACRELFRQFQSRILRDSLLFTERDLYLQAETLRASELGGSFLSGCTGLYFMFTFDEPTDLSYRPEEWSD